jgi:DNA-binding transcriptional LysR family regulator
VDLLNAIDVFNRVARLESFSAAARELGISKTAVSRHVLDLENTLGVRLLNRTTRRMSLTEAGLAYQARSSAILADIEELQNAVQNLHRKPAGVLRVTSAVTFGHCSLTPVIADFLAAYPDINVQLDLTNRFVDVVAEGYDLAIRVADRQNSGLISRPLVAAKRYTCAAPRYIERWGEPATPADLASHACVVFLTHGTEARWHFADAEREHAVTVSGRLLVNSTEAAARAVRDGVGIGVLPDYAVGRMLASGEVRRVLAGYDIKGWHHIYAVYPHRHHLSTKVRVFIDYLAAALSHIERAGRPQLRAKRL